MDDATVGRALRSIRQHLHLRQRDVATRAGVSQQAVSLLETGGLGLVSFRSVRRVAHAPGADVTVSVRWRGAELDRVRDEAHATVVATVAALLEANGWITAPEVTYSWYGERGSIDLLAFHPSTRTSLVVEVKMEIASVEETLRRHDQKVRLATRIARDRFGWEARHVTRLLAIRDASTARRRVERHEGVFRRAYPVRGWAARGWLAAPAGSAGLLLFLSGTSRLGGSRGSATIQSGRRGHAHSMRPRRAGSDRDRDSTSRAGR